MAQTPCVLVLLTAITCISTNVATAYSRWALPPEQKILNGTVVTSVPQWSSRRAEILDLLSENIYGTFPSAAPAPLVSSDVLNSTQQRGYEVSWVNLTWATPLFLSNAVVEVIRPLHCTAAATCPVSVVSKEHRRWLLVGALRGYIGVSTPCGDNSCEDPSCTLVDPTRALAQNYPAATFQARRVMERGRAWEGPNPPPLHPSPAHRTPRLPHYTHRRLHRYDAVRYGGRG